MGYEDSKYYERISNFTDGCNDTAKIGIKSLEFLDDELAHPEIYGTWLSNGMHFNGTAEYLWENDFDDNIPDDEFLLLLGIAYAEMKIFEKYGHKSGWMAEMINEAVEKRINNLSR